MDSKENGLGFKRSESFSGQNHICNRLSLSDELRNEKPWRQRSRAQASLVGAA